MPIFTQITNHEEQQKDRLITQYKDATNINKILKVYAAQVQEFEDEAFKLITERTLDGSVGFQLDQMGTILNEPRQGLIDDDYRIRLKAKIAENISEGTPEDLISIFRILLNPQEIHYNEVYPAGFELTAIGSQDPISSIDRIKDALNRAKPAGVELVAIKQVTRFPEFVFFDDPDPTGGGFRDLLNLLETGPAFDLGEYGELILTASPFGFAADTDRTVKGFRDLNDLQQTITPFAFDGIAGEGLGDVNSPSVGGDFSEIVETQTGATPGDAGDFASFSDTVTDDASLGDVNDTGLGKTFATILETDTLDTLNPDAGFFSDII